MRDDVAAQPSRVPITRDPEFTRGHANFPRWGWTLWGLSLATGLDALAGGWEASLGATIAYAVIWLPWGAYLLGRRHAGS